MKNILSLILLFISIIPSKSQEFYDITEDVSQYPQYKKAEFSHVSNNIYYFKHTLSSIPKSKVTAFRFRFDQFDETFKGSLILCTVVPESTSDTDLKTILDNLSEATSSCRGGFNEEDNGNYDGIIKLDTTKNKIGIKLHVEGIITFNARIYLRILEEELEVKEQRKFTDELYTLNPLTVVIANFRNYASKILFYSYTRELQMYYVEGDVTYPEKLFCGNVLSVYTNENQVRQKYKNAKTMILLTRDFSKDDIVSELFQFEVRFFPSNYLLDYFVSTNPSGRTKNAPLAINMTECTNPYYVVLNYNNPEKKTSLYIDQIYGKIKKLSVAPTFTSITWDDMITDDMIEIESSYRYYELPADSESHMDVYKVECDLPLLLNFYYKDEQETIKDLDYGHVVIVNLKSLKTVSLPFASSVTSAILAIEVFNPIKLPFIIINDGERENIISKNSLTKSVLLSTKNPVLLKERGKDSNTRVIIKVGYLYMNWEKKGTDLYYNSTSNLFVYYFPNNQERLNYTHVDLVTIGTTEGDNIKYCYAASIGTPILPSSENCYRVSLNNPYTLKALNPLILYKNYDFDEDVGYFITIKPEYINDKMQVNPSLYKYDTMERNIEGISNTIEFTSSQQGKSILTAPIEKDAKEFIQITQCQKSDIKFKLVNALYPDQEVINETTITSGTKNFHKIFDNILLETELIISGSNTNNKVFVRHSGIRDKYILDIIENPSITFNSTTNQIIMQHPINTYEGIIYTVYIGKEGELSNQDITLCSIAENKITSYSKSTTSYAETASIPINFEKVGLKAGDTFEAIVYYEQKLYTKMVFLSEIFKGIVGEIKTDVITEINNVYTEDNDYVYAKGTATSDGKSLYFSYMPTDKRDVPVGAFRIEFNSEYTKTLSRVSCAFVDEGESASGMIEAVEDIISVANPYCIGGKSVTNGKNYNYIFRFSYTSDNKPRKMVIKISNDQQINDGFTVYLRKGENTYINSTDFDEQREYGKREEYQKTMMPYIVDLELIRGNSTDNYVSKVLIFSRYLEMQMYYLDETNERNMPILFFKGGVMLVYTKKDLAMQKYHTTKLILLSENLNGQEHSGNIFRFHTKMFRTTDQIEFFESNNPTGRTLNFPLSLEINTCEEGNNKYYYILNYNRAEDERILYLDLLYGIMKRARALKSVESYYWNETIKNNMEEIKDMQIILGRNSLHIDIVEIECQTPLLANAYYTTESEEYLDLKKGNIAIKTLPALGSSTITLDPTLSGVLYCSISLYNQNANPDMTINYGNGNIETLQGNILKLAILTSPPQSVSITNNGNSNSRFIFKIGYGVESETDWMEDKEAEINGKLYFKENKYVYKFPADINKNNFTNVEILVKPLKKDTGEISPNLKFCYSTSIGMAIDASKENCFRTGANIPYSLNFINPLIAPKTYRTTIDNYYITFNPYMFSDYITLSFTENKYDIDQRSFEGVASVLPLGILNQGSIILSTPADSLSKDIFVQLQACTTKYDNITYIQSNAYSKKEIIRGNLRKNSKLFYYKIANNQMETRLDFNGFYQDKVFIKHMGIIDQEINIGEYSASWVEAKNVVNILKPILNNEAFRITVLVGKKGRFNDYSLCTFKETEEKDYKTLGDYVATFTSVSSDTVPHYIDFSGMEDYKEGKEFDLLVYAVQVNKMKIEVLYNIISGKVGKPEGVEEISGTIPNKKDYVTQLFVKNTTTSNYLFYNFKSKPLGDVASLKITSENDYGLIIGKVICTLVKSSTSPQEMISEVNKAERTSSSLCLGESIKDSNGFDALINMKNYEKELTKLVILVRYGIGENEEMNEQDVIMNITLMTTGVNVNKEGFGYNEDEQLTLVPYVFDLKEIRNMQTENYHSKVLIYSSTRELDMYYLDNGQPIELFSGNIMMVYTNEEVIKEKYNGATTMILLTNSLSKPSQTYISENFKFKVFFFNSAAQMQYFVSSNPGGRTLNNPTTIEMLNCDQPYYYILNYHFTEGDRMLHIDKIFGEIETTKFADQLTADSWDTFVEEMNTFNGNEYIIKGQNKYHIDVFEVTCKTPLLLNVYYTDESNPKKSGLKQGDMTVITLHPNTDEYLSFKEDLRGQVFLYSFTVHRKYGPPDVLIEFETKNSMRINQNGIFIHNTTENYNLIHVTNKQLTGDDTTKIIFKFGYNIFESFTKIENDMYNLQTEDRSDNIFAYLFKNGDDRLNYTKVDFLVSTTYDNVKFCYSTNLGTFLNPSMQNCFRVGKTNSYTISVMNPYIMYKDYYTGDNIMEYYVAFKTEDKDLNITIKPTLYKYDTENRNMPETPKSIIINNNEKTILTNPNNREYLFIQLELCTPNTAVRYQLKNAFYNTSIGQNGEIQSGRKYTYINILNTKLDTELLMESDDTNVNMFIKHTGLNLEFTPNVKNIKITYKDNNLTFTQPIEDEEFKYTILLDKINNIKNQHYTICSFSQERKMAYYTDYVTSSQKEVSYILDFNKEELEGYEDFEVLILAQEINHGKMMILSDVYSPSEDSDNSGEEGTRTTLIIIIVVLAVILIAGGVFIFFYIRIIKNKPRGAILSKPTDFTDIQDANPGEKILDSMAQSQAVENQQN